MNIREEFKFEEGQDVIIEFERILKNNDINVSIDSDMESKFLSVFDILFHFKSGKPLDSNVDKRALFRDFSALYDLALKVVNVESNSAFNQLIPHLNLLNGCAISQNTSSLITDQDSNKIIELYLACLCMRLSNNVSLDHPQNSHGDNPDVIAEINRVNWGVACKTVHTINPQTIYENIKKAVDQIDKSKSDVGITVINLKNVIDHDKIWPKDTSFQSVDAPLNQLFNNIDMVKTSLLKTIGKDELLSVFEGKKSLPGVIFIGQSVSSVFLPETNSPTATRLNVMRLFSLDDGGFTDEQFNTLNEINHYMQLANRDF
ncbi:hypothetical protein [Klebsiella aerogenes]|uniref:hypothetical protein n=1 Tax=Klebsiella aerogenes TaxID=548 RepID=UPI003D982714